MKWLTFGVMALAVAGCSKAPQGNQDSGDGGPAPVITEAPDYTDAEKAAILATFPAPYNQADLKDGEKQFGRCRSCHTLAPGAGNMVGPPLFGVFGRMSGSLTTYPYSDAMKAHNTVWDFQSLDTYLTDPQHVVKGTRMGFIGIEDPIKRRDLIAYLKLESTARPSEASSPASDSASAP